jgi:UDP-glucose 4-epimerase
MRCLVTGGAGFIGSHLVERLLARGHQVRVLDDLATGNRENLRAVAAQIEIIEGSVTDPQCVQSTVQGSEWVFHLAALPSVARSIQTPLETHAVCATGTLTLLDAACRAGVRRFLYASSSSVYGNSPHIRRSESDSLSPLSPYAAAKLTGEYYCQCFAAVHGLQTVRLRFFNVFGPRQCADSPYAGVIPLFATTLLRGERPTIHGDGSQSRDFTFVGDVVEGLLLAAGTPEATAKVYNLGAGGTTSILELLRILQGLLGTSLEPHFLPARPGDVRHSCADIARARAELGYAPTVSLEDGLRRTVDAFRAG